MRPQRLVVGTDFSACAERALQVALGLARLFDARTELVHVFDPAPREMGRARTPAGAQDIAAQLARSAAATLERAAPPGVAHNTVPHRSAPLGLCDHAQAAGADLLVTGSEGHTGLGHLMLGSVAEKVVRHAPCAVLVVRPATEPAGFPRHVMVATDFSKGARPALDQAVALAKAAGARLSLAHVFDDTPPIVTHKADAETRLAELEQSLRAGGLSGPLDSKVLVGISAADRLARHLRTLGADLCVVATHGRTGLTRLLLGSVAEQLVRLAPSAVWIAR